MTKPSAFLSQKVYHQSQGDELRSERVIRIGFYKAISILVGAVLASAGASIWGTLRVANTIPFRVDAIEKVVNDLPSKYMPLDLSTEKWKTNTIDHTRIENKLETIEKKIDDIRNLIK